MFTIQDYIDSLNRDKESLVANLTTKGITCSDTETFTTLVPKVLDITSVNNQSKSETITSNTTTTITPDEGYTGLSSVEVTTNVALDLSEYFTGTLQYNYGLNGAILMLKTIPNNTIVTGNDLRSVFNGCNNLITIPNLDISNVIRLDGMCTNCNALVNFEIKSAPSCTGFQYMFSGCNSLSDNSLDNILQMCASATNYTGTKTLAYLYINDRTIYPTSRIEALPHYSDFTTAGWTID